ncbi:protein argonaute 5 [Capsicum chacoense]|uniref:protein argonaute 5 n=1 Tax=Capsicum annuum TaxID=4072 RepID=UPI0007BF7BDB|nr:protein argonaute 5 [Capsicum annuum]
MSERGRGRGYRGGASGGGRGGGGRTPPSSGGRGGRAPSPSGGRAGGSGGGWPSAPGGRGRGGGGYSGGGSGYSGGGGGGGYSGGSPGFTSPPYQQQRSSSMAGPSSAAGPSLSREVEQKLSLQASTSTQPPPSPTAAQPVAVQHSEAGPSAPRPLPASSKAIRVPRRPGFGSSGWKCVVRANHFLVQVADRDLHHYDVTITPEVLSKKVCRNIINQLDADYKVSHLGNLRLAYDGRKSAYTAGPLPFASKEFVVKLIDDDGGARRERQFKVSIKFAAKVDIHHLKEFLQSRQSDAPHETIQALDVVLRSKPSVDYVVAGRSFFDKSFGFGRLPEGLEYWKGYYQSLRPTQMGLSLNIDMSARAFYEPLYVIDFIRQYLNLRDPHRGLADQDRAKVRKVLKGVKVEANHQGVRRYKITGLSNQPVRDITFSVDGTERMTSIVNYFREKYNIVVQYPLLPALQAGSNSKPVYLPMELCKIVKGQRYTKVLNGRQVAEMLKATCQRPEERERGIMQIVAANNYNHDPMVEDFGLGVRNELTTINARVLQAPTIKYHGSGQHSTVDPGVGHWNMIDKKMINGGRVDTWACVSFSPQVDPASFSRLVIDMCRNKGMAFSANPLVPFRQAHSRLVEKTLGDIHRESTTELARGGHPVNYLQLLIIVVPDVPGHYGTIKRVCETDLGIVSQCCQPKNAFRPNRQYLENLALKINVKVGGRNSVLDLAVRRRIPYLTDIPTIVFGADVTHPQPGEDSSPSIAAVVASMDWPEITTYRGIVSAQPHRKEIIMDLYTEKEDPQKGIVRGGMIMELLKEFKKSTGHKPGRIIFYRDGVSEGQFNQVLLDEMDAIRKACTSLQEDYLPRVTFVVVQKRHHTRLFPAMHNDRQTTDKSGNILPGTVVDTHICHPTEFDFYLCSHAGIKGTSRPAHYHVLFDENNFTADAIQNVTNYLCYTYARCTRSVSLVPPAYYAHLAAFRARYYIEDDADLRSTTDGGGTREQRATEVRPLPEIHRNVKNVMFYC